MFPFDVFFLYVVSCLITFFIAFFGQCCHVFCLCRSFSNMLFESRAVFLFYFCFLFGKGRRGRFGTVSMGFCFFCVCHPRMTNHQKPLKFRWHRLMFIHKHYSKETSMLLETFACYVFFVYLWDIDMVTANYK